MNQKLEIDGNIYSIDAVKYAAYDMCNIASFDIKLGLNNSICISFSSINSNFSDFQVITMFNNKLLDHQIRLDLAVKTKNIRDILIAQAFAPCDNIDDIIKAILNED